MMPTLRIVIDARMYNESGIGRYIRNLIGQLQLLDKENEYFIIFLKGEYDRLVLDNFSFVKVLGNFKWYGISEQVRLPKLLKSLKPDLVHFPHFNVPTFYNGKFVVTIHDLIHQHFSMQRSTTHGPFIYKLKQLGYGKVFQSAIKNSAKILVPSNFVKDQLKKQWDLDDKKIVVTKEGVDDKIFRIAKKMFKGKKEYSYIFYVGNAHPHKNVAGLIKAFLRIKQKNKNLKLVLAGKDHYFWQRIKKEFTHQDIVYTGYVTDEELVALYMGAECLVLPSFEEGFGIPILEAFALSCPVVSSNIGALLEVGGKACLYFNPHNTDDMVEKVEMVLSDENLRKVLIKNGKERVKKFSWKKLAEQTLEVYQNACSIST